MVIARARASPNPGISTSNRVFCLRAVLRKECVGATSDTLLACANMRRTRPPASIPYIMRSVVSLLLAAVLLSACGYKGALYLPKPEAQPPAPAPDTAKKSAPSQ